MPVQILGLLAFVMVAAGVVGIYMLLVGRSQAAQEKTIESRLQEASGFFAAPTPQESLLVQETTGPLPNVDRAARQAIKGSGFEKWLEQTGTKMSLTGVLLSALMLGVAGAIISYSFSRMLWVGLLGFLAGFGLFIVLLRQKRSRRLYKFEEHFPEALDLLSRAIRAGHAFSAGMKMVADELDEPVGPEFRKAFDEQNYGLPLKESLNNLSERIPLLDVRFFSTAVLIQRDTGGNLSEILDNLSNVVRERFKIRRQVRVHTAHGRFTGYVLMALPAFLALALTFINPEHMGLLFEERLGQLMIVGCIVMQAAGFIWIKQIVKIEV
jgi:tight adherence protein B